MNNTQATDWSNVRLDLNGKEVKVKPMQYVVHYKPYLVFFKTPSRGYDCYECYTIDEALALAARKDLGDFTCSYNLLTDTVLHNESPNDEELRAIIEELKKYI